MSEASANRLEAAGAPAGLCRLSHLPAYVATWMRRYGGADVQGLTETGNWRDPRSAARYSHVVAREEWDRVEGRGRAANE
jgi:hypothetical protein